MKQIILMFFVWLVVVNVFGLLVVNRINLQPDTAYIWINPQDVRQEQQWNLVSLHAKWDSFWYLDVAKNGYHIPANNTLANVVFFPLYPLLLAIGGFLLLGNYVLAGWFVSSIFLFLSLLYLYKFTKEFHTDIDPRLPILLLLIFPTAFFLNALYTESLFLFLSIATFYYAKKKKSGPVGFFGLLISLTRVTGVLLVIPLAWEYFKQHGFRIRSFFSWRIISVITPMLGLAGFFIYHAIAFGNLLLFFDIESAWGRTFTLNKDHILLISNPAIANFTLDIFFTLFAIVATVAVFRRFGFTYGGYMTATLIIALSTGTIMSIGRYILVLFPIYLLLASIQNIYFRYTWIFVSTLLFALYTLLFVNNYWAG